MFCTDSCHKQPLGEVLHSVEICFVTSLLKLYCFCFQKLKVPTKRKKRLTNNSPYPCSATTTPGSARRAARRSMPATPGTPSTPLNTKMYPFTIDTPTPTHTPRGIRMGTSTPHRWVKYNFFTLDNDWRKLIIESLASNGGTHGKFSWSICLLSWEIIKLCKCCIIHLTHDTSFNFSFYLPVYAFLVKFLFHISALIYVHILLSETWKRCDMAFIEPMHRNKPNITYWNMKPFIILFLVLYPILCYSGPQKNNT